MAEKAGFNGGIAYYQVLAKEFTPITVSADFGALERLQTLKKNLTVGAFRQIDTSVPKAA